MRIHARNAAFQQFEALKRNREKRAKQGLFFVEGVHPIEQAIRCGWTFEAMGWAEGARLSGWARDMLERARPAQRYEIEPALMAELSERDEPCELIALVRTRADGLARMGAGGDLFVLLDRVQSPGNLGTVMRSADAFRAAGLLTTGHCADFYDPQCARASVGAMFSLPFAAMGAREEAMAWLAALPARPRLLGTSARAQKTIAEVDLTAPVALLIGNETFGLSKGWRADCDELVRIPIFGAASSLNAGCAASICLYEIARQRGFPPG